MAKLNRDHAQDQAEPPQYSSKSAVMLFPRTFRDEHDVRVAARYNAQVIPEPTLAARC
jgi:hypothetical protein